MQRTQPFIAFGGFSLTGVAAPMLAGCGEPSTRKAAPQASARAITAVAVVGRPIVEMQAFFGRIEAVGSTHP